MAKNKNDYFEMFLKQVEYSCSAAEKLNETLKNFDASELPETMERMHSIEHAADIEKHGMMKTLAKEFITPIEREDIMSLAHEIDNLTDAIEDVLLKIYMFNITHIRKDAIEFSMVIHKCCLALKSALEEFPNFHKSQAIHTLLVEVNDFEEEGDRLYTEAVRTLYVTETDPINISAWRETYRNLERCCDACEDVANVIEGVIMKNS